MYNHVDIIDLAHSVSKYCIGMEGNVSKKTDNGLIIKASGSRMNNLSDADLVEFDNDGNQLSNLSKRPSIEFGFHKFLLGFEHINFVAHTHPIHTLQILVTDFAYDFANKRMFPDQVVFNNKKSCLVSYEVPGKNLTEEIKIGVKYFIQAEGFFPNLILLKNHGIISCGKTADECIMISDICEKAAEIFIGASSIGKINYLYSIDTTNILNDNNEKYRQQLLCT